MNLNVLIDSLAAHLPPVMRWAGSVARRMRNFNVALEGKHSGSSNTDALTLADLMVQELLVGALRDGDPLFRQCRIEAEESTGDLARFAKDSEYTLAVDPIDGTKQYRDKTGNGYSIILTLRSPQTVHFTLVFVPESGPFGSWVQVAGQRILCGPDDPGLTAIDVLRSMKPRPLAATSRSKKIYVIGFQQQDPARAELVSKAGLEGVAADNCPGCLYELMASGEYAGSLIHSPNVYDYPAGLHLARVCGGDSLWVHNQQPVNFDKLWMDERANMLRLPGIIATSPDRSILKTLCTLARDWNPVRYAE
jgi:3'(2'), 5'-bisphosphate nucleotidase